MTVAELMERIKTEMSGDAKTDLHRLSEIAQEYKKEENAEELMEAIANYAYEILPADTREQMEASTFVRGMRMDKAFATALQMIREDKNDEAESLLGAISDTIREHFEGEKKWFSFRNQFEYHMYRHFNPDDTQFDRAPFDFANYLQTYAFVQVNNGHTRAALETLGRAQKFNPMSVDVRFEQAEIYKLMQMTQMLHTCCRDTMLLSTSGSCYGRVCANMGYFCSLTGDLSSAAIFNFESMKFAPNKAIDIELQDVLRRMKTFGQSFAPPTKGQILDTYEKYGIPQPPNDDLVNLALTLADSAEQYGRLELEGLFLRYAFDMTHNDDIKARLDDLDKRIAAAKAEGAAE